jgi:hypothetical protein
MLVSSPTAVLLISPEPWSAHPVSKHHYARALARQGRPVLFVDPPDPALRQICLVPVPDQPGIWLVQGPRLATGLRFYPSRIRRRLERRWLHRLERLASLPVSSVWLFENSRFYDLRFAADRLKIYHQVDLNQIFHPHEAARTADLCFCTTELIRQQLIGHNSQVFRLHHGLAPVYAELELDTSQQQRLNIPGVHAAYIGNLDMAYLDQALLIRVIQSHPSVQFHLVGGHQSGNSLRQKLQNCPHVHWWGQVPSSLIPRILEHVDLQLVCYQVQHHDDQASPHKFMEYLASGRTIVATYTAEYAAHSNLLAMSDAGSNSGYLPLFQSVLTNLSQWNSPERMAARRAFAADHSYERQLQRIETHLQQFNLPALGLAAMA